MTPETTAYRGYLIRCHFLRPDSLWIEKDGFHISYAQSFADAKRIVNELLD